MALADVTDWIDEFGRPGFLWYVKRLSSNDTGANGTHQGGPYIPKDLAFKLLPGLDGPTDDNRDVRLDIFIDSHPEVRNIRVVWYNGKFRGATRDEVRMTQFGGRSSPLLDFDNTGALAVFAFEVDENGHARSCHIWVCGGDGTEADLFEERLGPVEPKQHIVWTPGDLLPSMDLFAEAASGRSSCRLPTSQIPAEWFSKFPTGEEIIRRTIEKRPLATANVDVRLMARRKCEYEMFLGVEEAVFLPRITEGFTSIDGFLSLAQTVLQSRKSRSGRSLELHIREILKEEGLVAGADFSHNPTIDANSKPDFLFPSDADYRNPAFPEAKLRMLAAKTTCKDRWRQVTKEASRVREKHLLTLQEGVSENQFQEMREAGVNLVVPVSLHSAYHENIRPHLISFESFVADIRHLKL